MKKMIFVTIFMMATSANARVKKIVIPQTDVKFNVLGSLEIESVTVRSECHRKAKLREIFGNGLDNFKSCYSHKINGVKSFATKRFRLERINETTYRFPATTFEFSDKRKGRLCVLVDVEFKNINYGDDTFEDPKDEWSVLSICSTKRKSLFPHPFPEYFQQNRVFSMKELKEVLERGIDLKLNI